MIREITVNRILDMICPGDERILSWIYWVVKLNVGILCVICWGLWLELAWGLQLYIIIHHGLSWFIHDPKGFQMVRDFT